MRKVRMLVQTMYRGELLRAGKEYEVSKDTADKWIISGLAVAIEDPE